MELNESVNITENIDPSSVPGSSFPPGTHIAVNDNFSTRNDFYGPQVGVRAEWWRDRFFANTRALVALGDSHETVSIDGTTVFTVGAVSRVPGGLLALPSNIGSYSRDSLPSFRRSVSTLAMRLHCNVRAYAGYTFMYWSNVVRPGDVIDTSVNPSQLPPIGGRGPRVGAARPAFEFHDSGFWAQGINLGVGLRY